MTTGLIDTRPTKVGDVLKFEYEPSTGYTREEVTVTVTEGMEVGAVLESTSVAGKYTLVAVATTADADGVLVDNSVNELAAGDATLAVLVRGPAGVADKSLTYAADVDTDVEKAAVWTALTANTAIKVLTQV